MLSPGSDNDSDGSDGWGAFSRTSDNPIHDLILLQNLSSDTSSSHCDSTSSESDDLLVVTNKSDPQLDPHNASVEYEMVGIDVNPSDLEIQIHSEHSEQQGQVFTRESILNSPLLLAATAEVIQTRQDPDSIQVGTDANSQFYNSEIYRLTDNDRNRNANEVHEKRGAVNQVRKLWKRYHATIYTILAGILIGTIITFVILAGIRQTSRSRDSSSPMFSDEATMSSSTVNPVSMSPTIPSPTVSPKIPFAPTSSIPSLEIKRTIQPSSSTPSQHPTIVSSLAVPSRQIPSSYPSKSRFNSTQKPHKIVNASRVPTISSTTNFTVGASEMPTAILPGFPNATSEEDQDSRRDTIKELCISLSGVLALMNPTSPQYRAMQWVMKDDPLMPTSRVTVLQRYVLSVFYFATNGNVSWKSCGPPEGKTDCGSEALRFLGSAPECNWLGIRCDSTNKITSISIRENGLKGQLPRELGALTRVSSLSLDHNALYGTIPANLKWLAQLRFLILNDNNYAGSIHNEVVSLETLTYLNLGGNSLTGSIPSKIFTPALQYIDLGSNLLNGTIPQSIFEVSEYLQHIDLSNNQLSGTLHSGLGQLIALRTFNAINNRLTGTLPGEIISDTLTMLDLGNNKFHGNLPVELFMFGSSLSFLNLGVNPLSGTISPRFGDLSSLKTLVFYFTELTGTLPSEIGQLSKLEILHLAGTNLHGTIPDEICTLRSMSTLQTVSSDCNGTKPEIECSCCTLCYNRSSVGDHRLLLL